METNKIKTRIESINNYSFEFMKERLLEDDNCFSSVEEIDYAINEFKKFLCLIAYDIKPLAMISPKIDEIWHQFLLFTEEYEKFCSNIFGIFIHHKPNTTLDPIPLSAIDNILIEYNNKFGVLPSIWFDDLDENSILYYTGKNRVKPPKKWSGWTG